jgi:enoyl-CoA hydratase
MVRIERDGAFAVWTISRPEAKNALNLQTLGYLAQAGEEAKRDPRLRAVILTGDGDAFVSGGDLRELRDRNSVADAEEFAEAGSRVCRALEELDVPVIAAIPGPAYGGGAELAVACDLRIADPKAKISFKQVRMGVTTGWGTIPRLVALCGHGTAARLLYTGHEISAASALAMGLVDAVAEGGGCVAAALAWAYDIAQGSPNAVAEMKGLLREARQATPSRERERFIQTWTAPDHAEAMAAYFSRRPPAWSKP